MIAKFLVLAVLLPVIYGDTCLAPQIQSTTYSSSDDVVTTKTAFILEFTLKCKNGLKNLNLFAQVDDDIFPVVRSGSGYQVSWTTPHKAVRSGRYDVRIFDEEGYSSLRKAQRSGEETSKLKPLTVISFEHKAPWGGPAVSSEFIVIFIAVVLLYFAHSAKSTIQH